MTDIVWQSLITGIVGIILGYFQFQIARQQKEQTKQTQELKQNVNGITEARIESVKKVAILEEKVTAQVLAKAEVAIADAATLKEQQRVALIVPVVPQVLAPTAPIPVIVVAGPSQEAEAIRTKTDA